MVVPPRGENNVIGVFFLLNMTRVKRILLVSCLAAALAVSLASCTLLRPASSGGAANSAPDHSDVSGQDMPDVSEPDASGADQEAQTLHGTLNTADAELGLLIVVSEEQYFRFDLNGADVSALAPGDEVVVTYTGELEPDSDELTAVVTAVVKAEEAPAA